MSPKVTSLEEEGGADMDGAERDEAEREGGAAESDYRDRSWASPTFNGSVIYGTYDGKMVGKAKRNGKMA